MVSHMNMHETTGIICKMMKILLLFAKRKNNHRVQETYSSLLQQAQLVQKAMSQKQI